MDQATSLTVSSVQDSQSSSRTAVNGSRTVVVLWTGRRQGRLDEDGPRPTAVRLPPLEGRSSTTFFTLIFYSYFLFLFLFSALTYLSTSMSHRPILRACSRRPSTPSRTAPRQSVPSKDETASSFVVLTPSWTDGTTGISAYSLGCLEQAKDV